MDIKSLINKVISSKGILRVPSWWMKKLLTEIVGYIDSGDSANANSIDNITTEISHIKNLSLPYMLVSGTGIVNIDGKKVSFTDANKQLIYITGAINFEKQDSSLNDLITYIYIPHIDIRSQGRSMLGMFEYCSSITSLDLSSFNTSAVTNMDQMFDSCRALTSLDISSFDTSSVTDMDQMFYSCKALTSLDLSSFDTSAVTSMWFMFVDCISLTSLILGPNFFKTSAVTNIDFWYCSKWTNDTVVTSLVTNSYNRASAGLNTLTLKLHKNTKVALTNEQKAAITSKGYTIA